MELFKRFPKLRLYPRNDHIIAPDDRSKYPAFAEDFETLDKELIPIFRELDNEAVFEQNRYRWTYVLLIFGGALTTLLVILQLAFLNVVGLDIAGAVLAALLGMVTAITRSFKYHERYMNARLAAERLRGEYFLFLGRLGQYADNQNRLQNLIYNISKIKQKGEHNESA